MSKEKTSDVALLHKYIDEGNLKEIRGLLNQNKELVNKPYRLFKEATSEQTPLGKAVTCYCESNYGDTEKKQKYFIIIQLLVDYGAGLNIDLILPSNHQGTPAWIVCTPLDTALNYIKGTPLDIELITCLINGDTINAKSSMREYTPLMTAVLRLEPNLNVIRLLLEKGALLGEKNKESRSALEIEQEKHPKNKELINLLEEALKKETSRSNSLSSSGPNAVEESQVVLVN